MKDTYELPELPCPDKNFHTDYSADAMQEYARSAVRAALAAQPDAPASDWPDVSPAGLRKMAEIAAPNNGAVFRAAADEIERLAAQPVAQATNCAGCGEHKHTPLRIDAMGGYVCLTCIDKKLGCLLGEFGYPQPEPAAQDKEDADMFWNHDDPEACARAIVDIIQDYGPGDVVKIDRAKSMPAITVRVLPRKDEDDDCFGYEFIDDDAARAATEPQGGA